MDDVRTPLVSFYMTVRNGFPFLPKAIESIKNQTYLNWEAVIVDDGSSDDSVKYLREVERQDSRFRIIATEGVGRGKALNMAIENARGVYVANLDADDLAHPQRIDIQVSILIATGALFLYSDAEFVYDDGVADWTPISGPFNNHLDDVSMELMKRNPVSHISVISQRKSILEVGGYSQTRKSQLDYELWFRLVKHGIKLQKMGYTLVAKRIHTGQSFENKRRMKYLFSSTALQNKIITEMQGGIRYRIYPALRLLYGLLPQKLRVHIRQ
ncbi:glycosyltransferase involved in cell wall biosynthesis [Onishia taeanensis]|uniref:Glycosyltransferase involved in cell wall biosynthesis n=1 Tax=Onishia taeanensis TaxID=284577 RepID=A0A328XK85_9GAMM|nr:glycosyltransferase [Halomonas taeanensis]RAR59101.1 glycosyltransferase involved in cell wall biosynthesis [Halomonas taeanensis]